MEYVMSLTPVPKMVIMTGMRPKYVYKDGKATDEQETTDRGTPMWRVDLMVVGQDGSGVVTCNMASKTQFDVPLMASDPSKLMFRGRTYGPRQTSVTLELVKGGSFTAM